MSSIPFQSLKPLKTSGPQLSTCDECRRRKLKCTGRAPDACERCRRESMLCVYSDRKPMGRPRKRLREDTVGTDGYVQSWDDPSAGLGLVGLGSRGDLDQEFAPANGDSLFHESNWVGDQLQSNGSHSEAVEVSYNIDPALGGSAFETLPTHAVQQDVSPPDSTCMCLPTYYLAAADLPSANSVGFPSALAPLKSALATAEQLLECDKCPQDLVSYKQNILLLTSLLSSIASGFEKLLRKIDVEADNAKTAGSRLVLTMGDRSLVNAHRHTGTDDCPARFDLELDAEEWRVLTKRVVGKEISEKQNASRTLEGLISGTERRQDLWHRSELAVEEYERPDQERPVSGCAILNLTKEVRRQISHFKI